MKTLDKKIGLEVHSKNELARIVKAELEHIMPQVEKFIGKKIFTLQGLAKIFSVNFLKVAPVGYKDGSAVHQGCYFLSEYGTLRLKFRLYFNSFGITEYEERAVEIGKLGDGGTLESLYTIDKILKDYGFDVVLDEEEQLCRVAEYISLKEAMKESLSEISGKIKVSFGLYSNASSGETSLLS